MTWVAPSLQVHWGPYFKPDPDEQQKTVALVQAALGAGGIAGPGTPLITLRAAVEKIAPIFGIENVDAALDALEQENQDRADAELEKTTKEQEALHSLAASMNVGGSQPGGNRPPSGAKPPGAQGSGSRGAPAAPARPK